MKHRSEMTAAVLLLVASVINAQDDLQPTDSDGLSVFPAAFYAAGGPISALDVANRTPGFSLDEGQTELRGLEGAAGNVLIDGRRPATKTLSLSEVLERIPFSAIDRAELIRAGTEGFDMMGRRVVLNIVRKVDSDSQLTAEAAASYYPDNPQHLGGAGRLEYSRSTEKYKVEAGLRYSSEQYSKSGEGGLWRIPSDGGSTLYGTYNGDDWEETLQATSAASVALGKTEVTAHLAASQSLLTIEQQSEFSPVMGDPFGEFTRFEKEIDAVEIGTDINRQFQDSRRLNIQVLHRSNSESTDSSLAVGDSQALARDVHDLSETALRGVFRWDLSALLSLEFGAEAAFNRLDSLVAVNIDGAELDLPNSDITVSEDRYQASAGAIIQVGSRWLVEAGAGFETSTLTQSGDANLEKKLDYVKPRITATWSVSETTDFRLGYEYVVGQLSFNNFAASACLICGISSAGNADLEPEESDQFKFEIERRFWGDGSAALILVHSKFKNALDYIPVGEGFDARGNAGRATKNYWTLNLTLPFDRLGWSGATFRTNLMYSESEIVDPFTGEIRSISGRDGLTGNLGFTWELPEQRSVLGLDGFWGWDDHTYRVSEERSDRELPVPVSIWWDRTLGNGAVVRLEVFNVFGQRLKRDRDLYADGRASGVMTEREVRTNYQDPHLMVRIRKSF